MDRALSKYAESDQVDNIIIYVSDALRYDRLPTKIRELGVTAKTVAASTFTASSLPSIMTGQYPATHRIWRFQDQLPERPALLTENGVTVGFNAETVWIELDSSDKPPLRIHRLEEESTLDDLDEPFTYVVHDVGPHAPYGFENGVFESTKHFFRENRDYRELVDLYERDCVNSADRFMPILDEIVDEDALDNTLLIYTSDHGQALGEVTNGGVFGHGHPMAPETVYVPTVFIGAGLPEDEQYDHLLSGTDIAPTALRAQNRPAQEAIDGTEVWTSTPEEGRRLRSDIWQHLYLGTNDLTYPLTVYAATSAWDRNSGIVFHSKSRLERTGCLVYDNLFRDSAPAWRSNWSFRNQIHLLELCLSNTLTYGAPTFSIADAKDQIPEKFTERYASDREEVDEFSKEQHDQLRALGYIG